VSTDPIAYKYAEALFDVAKTHNCVDEIASNLDVFTGILRDTPEINQFLRSFQVKTSEKVGVFRKAFADQMSQYLLNTISILLEHRRAELFFDLQNAFQELVRVDRGIVPVHTTTATSMDNDLRALVRNALEQKLDKSVELTASQDESILGGLKLQIGNMVYDGSLARQLQKLKQQLT